jgi:hypothetical protein
MDRRTAIRVVLVSVLLVSAGILALDWTAASANAPAVTVDRTGATEGGNVTVITTDPPGGTSGSAAIVALTAEGRILYRNDSYGNYFDVDPDPPGSRTMLYVAGSRYEQCPEALEARSDGTFEDGCAEVVVERVDLSTGETERVHSTVTEWDIWHDVDRIGEHRLLVADLSRDRVFVLDTSTDAVEWEWRAAEDLDPDSGGQPGDWTHLNDVESLDDGRVMASLRNQDRVVFLDPGDGLVANRTLGAENAYGVLYEQHNPDYIPPERGGPAVVVADSENNRVVEYRYANGQWRQVWSWRDDDLRWPRDADRLPGGHTLVTDSQGNRVIELDENDEVVWRADVPTPYEAERLGTGDESATGRSKAALADDADGPGEADRADRAERTTGIAWLVAFLAGPVVNGLLYAAPAWMTFQGLLAALVVGATAVTWVAFELYWSRTSLQMPDRFG